MVARSRYVLEVPRIEFWSTERDAILWTFDREPSIGEEVVLGDRGVYRVLGRRHDDVPGADVAFDVERVRDSTSEDIKAMLERGVDRLPSA